MRTAKQILAVLFTIVVFIASGEAKVTVKTIDWRGWDQSVEISNGDTKLVVVPAIGRIMHYGLTDGENLLWNLPALYGKTKAIKDLGNIRNWYNFGGDKVWPTQQDDFPALNGVAWPPDDWFDGAPCTAELLDDGVKITTMVSPNCGARLTRSIRLAASGSRVTIDQHLEKVQPAANTDAEPIDFTIWNVTQIRSPQVVLFDLNPQSKFENGYYAQRPESETGFSSKDGIGIFTPHKVKHFKIGADGLSWLAAIVDDMAIAEFFIMDPQATYPDKGCSIEIYTSPMLTELEPLSPLQTLQPGESMDFTIEWDLYTLPAELEAQDTRIKAVSKWAESVKMQ